jgi:hypothetical protein
MGCHLGWHFAVCCPLRGGRGVFIKNTKKQLRIGKRGKDYQNITRAGQLEQGNH